MKNICIHGLGQNSRSWESTNRYLQEHHIDTLCPDLFEMVKETPKDYFGMYAAFSQFCLGHEDMLNLCGLSLGGVLALDFAKEYPEKVNSLILINTPYTIPKLLFKMQTAAFHMMPRKAFEKMGCAKQDLIVLVRSMANLDIAKGIEAIPCESLVVCGAKDKVNKKSAQLLQQHLKQSKLRIVQNASHEINIDNPEELAGLIYEFWQKKQ